MTPAFAAAAALILGLAAFTQSLSGFGLALVSMPLLTLLVSVPEATAWVAVISLFVEAWLLRRYWVHLQWRPVRHLLAASVVGVPVGVVLLQRLPESALKGGLGGLLLAYGLYALLGLKLPPLESRRWAWLAGFVAGAFGGAYNTSGPPVILYGHARRWTPEAFKANLQAFFLVNSGVVFFVHLALGDITAVTWQRALLSLPALALGLWLGKAASTRLAPPRFRQMVLVMLALLGAKMLF